ncbi:hypothetical protein GPL15_17445 [Clostridium sp. MCC353]|uniref:hypothetical protein n=1 Tax=Clostridium sp. MCC353 TaxID=2592646 RepID=UPI001C01227D|nr:hypothetical protein [Clostridium sp. MCC353]MBT9778286.1 hypothetical protein [Clostridium sp. MCC353]
MIADDRENILKGGLLDELAKQLCSDYLSDLRLPANRLSLVPLLNRINPASFTVNGWNDAISYILGERKQFDSQEKARDYIISRIIETDNSYK